MNNDRRKGFNIDYVCLNRIKFYPIYDGRQWFVSACGKVIGATGTILKPKDNGNGYLIVSYQNARGKISNKYVHRLVCKVFGHNYNVAVNHKDGNKHNNHKDNLEWCDYKANTAHAINTGLLSNLPAKGQQGFQHGDD